MHSAITLGQTRQLWGGQAYSLSEGHPTPFRKAHFFHLNGLFEFRSGKSGYFWKPPWAG